MTDVLFVDDDDDLRHATAQSLTLAGLTVVTATGGAAALREIEQGFEGVVVTDMRMPGIDGLELMARVVARDPDMPVILVSGHADVASAVDALRRGAYDVLEKPFAVDHLVASIERAAERQRLVAENRRLRAAPLDPSEGPLLGHSALIEQLRRTIAQVAAIDIDVLILGETGTGKGVVAQMIHSLSRRRGNLVTVDCGAMPTGIIEAELFGHVAGAVPGNHMPRTGRIEQAHRGTLFLDEIDAMSDPVQLNVQRVLEHREVTPLGATTARALDLRVVSSSSSDLESLVQQGRFRPSLFYRLNGVTLRIPALRERREDVTPLFHAFVLRAAARLGVTPPTLDAQTFRHLQTHHWPGNVRELIRFADSFVLGLSAHAGAAPIEPDQQDLKSRVDAFEAQLIEEAIAAAHGDASRACQSLGLPRKTFYYKVQRLGIDLSRFR